MTLEQIIFNFCMVYFNSHYVSIFFLSKLYSGSSKDW
jgi:hypothetical protein